MSANWTGPDKRECASCGRSEACNSLGLCRECMEAYVEETRQWEAMERLDDDVAAARSFYNG